MKKIAVLGATGSVGTQALEVAREFKEEIEIVGLSAHTNIEKLAAAANEFRPKYLAVTGEEADKDKLAGLLNYEAVISVGRDAPIDVVLASECDMAVLSILGIAGLPVFVACLENKISVALANKESMVCGGDVVCGIMERTKTQVLPVDSEHMAIFQCLGDSYDVSNVSKLWLTASGGPFLNLSREEIENATVERALQHPNWDMGRKISIDSASLANKGLEIMEAHFLYGLPGEQIEVVVQPKSLVHSMVEFRDCSVLAQMGPVDMRLPLQKSMLFPKVCKFTMNKPLDFKKLGIIEFVEPDMKRFPCLRLAYEAISSQTTAVYNIANEMAVELFLNRAIRFGDIPRAIGRSMDAFAGEKPGSIEEILDLDTRVRRFVLEQYTG